MDPEAVSTGRVTLEAHVSWLNLKRYSRNASKEGLCMRLRLFGLTMIPGLTGKSISVSDFMTERGIRDHI